MRRFRLKTQFVLGAVALVLLLGGLAIFSVHTVVSRQLAGEVEQRVKILAHGFASASLESVLMEDWVSLQMVVNDFASREGVAYAFVLDGVGHPLADSLKHRVPTALAKVNSATAEESLALPAEEVSIRHVDADGRDVVDAAALLLDGSPGQVRIGMSSEVIEESVRGMKQRLSLLTGLVLLLGAIAAALLARAIITPLAELGRASRAVAEGDFSRKVETREGDEIGDLATAFNRMLETIRLEQDRNQATLARLRKTLGGVIDAISIAGERRDPYAAGHQKRVADLARAVAARMALSADEVEGIRVAAVLHDIGKLSVPSELLTLCRPLEPIEREIIKTHSAVGFEILKSIDFPWPIAETVRQHHERLDGSGYPDGLKGDAISLGARILAVADVVEAMSSHRPYRPALGTEAALAEIAGNRGRLHDPAVADACAAVFRQDGFQFRNAI